MKTNEHDFYSEIANWSFEDINYTSEVITNWIYEDEIKKRVKENTKILDLGTAAGEKVLKKFPNCAEILGTDFSDEMIETANKNLLQSGRKNISFRVMNNLKINTPDNYFDLVIVKKEVDQLSTSFFISHVNFFFYFKKTLGFALYTISILKLFFFIISKRAQHDVLGSFFGY